MIIDVITYNGEGELFDLRYNILKDYVDEFIVVEFDKTFSGKPKEQLFTSMFMLGEKVFLLYPKVKYKWITEKQYSKYKDLAESSPNTKGADHWKMEFMQKESIKDCLTHLKDDDIVFIGDCDEIWEPRNLEKKFDKGGFTQFTLRVYTYYLNNRSSEIFNGIIVSHYEDIKNRCLNHVRSKPGQFFANGELEYISYRQAEYSGWHFTSMAYRLRQKLTDSYTEESYATPEVMARLDSNIKERKDFLGRNFTYKIDESEWPQYLKDNKLKYKHLLYESH